MRAIATAIVLVVLAGGVPSAGGKPRPLGLPTVAGTHSTPCPKQALPLPRYPLGSALSAAPAELRRHFRKTLGYVPRNISIDAAAASHGPVGVPHIFDLFLAKHQVYLERKCGQRVARRSIVLFVSMAAPSVTFSFKVAYMTLTSSGWRIWTHVLQTDPDKPVGPG